MFLQQNLTPNEGNSDAEDRKINSEKVCSKCSDELIKYYETWDLPLIGLSDEKEPEKIEQDLLKIIPKKYLKDANHIFVFHGRNICIAKHPKCDICPVKKYCNHYNNA